MALRRKTTFVLILPILLILVLSALALRIPRLRIALRIVEGFEPLVADNRIYFEKGAEEYAGMIAEALPAAIRRIETCQVRTFRSEPRIYICATHESFSSRIGQPPYIPVRGIAFKRDVWLSPLAFSFYGRDSHRQSLMHELSHTHISQHLSWSHRVRNLPTWFNEGLANWVSGTGEGRITRKEAIDAIRSGKALVPDDTGSFPRSKSPEDYGLTWPLLHLQSLMFVEYLVARDSRAFDLFLGEVLDGERFGPSFIKQFGAAPDSLWTEFIGSLE